LCQLIRLHLSPSVSSAGLREFSRGAEQLHGSEFALSGKPAAHLGVPTAVSTQTILLLRSCKSVKHSAAATAVDNAPGSGTDATRKPVLLSSFSVRLDL